MITIGLIGGVACGKSMVAQSFRKLGACILDGDRIGHETLADPDVQGQLVQRWGKRVLDPGGQLDRGSIASIVFDNSPEAAEELQFLESVTHPQIRLQIERRLGQTRQLGRAPLAVLDAAIMLKAGWDELCDRIVFVDAPVPLREKRAVLRGLTVEQFRQREAAQIPVEEKRSHADFVIDNSGPPHQTYQQVEEVWHSLLQIA